MIESKGNFISGKWIKGAGNPFESLEPSFDTPFWQGNFSSVEQVEDALKSARSALKSWQKNPDRISVIQKFQQQLEINKSVLAQAIGQETGKPLWEAQTEVAAMIGKIAISIKAQEERAGVKLNSNNSLTYATRHKPHGVLAIMGPFNFPGHLPNGHIVPALLAGNTIVFKPSEETPYVAEIMVDLWKEAGLPSGVLNLIQGDASVGRAIVENPSIDGLLFTGSFHTGAQLSQNFAGRPSKILALEMGGNNPLIIGSIGCIESAVYTTLLSAFITSGQRCTCARRLVLCKDRVPDGFLDSLLEATKSLSVGAYNANPEHFMGSLINSRAAKAVQNHYSGLLKFGAKDILAPKGVEEKKCYATPALIDISDINPPDEEVFGPVLHIKWVKDLNEAIHFANATGYGLSAGLLSDDKKEYTSVYEEIRAGIINWNTQLTGASSAAPFGGIGKSGNFRPSAYYAVDYCNYPVASVESERCVMPEKPLPGIRA